MYTSSPDSYIRLTLNELDGVPLRNIHNEIDDSYAEELRGLGVQLKSAGFTEWCSDDTPSLSIGFGFIERLIDGKVVLDLAPDPIRGNIMLIDNRGYDIDSAQCNLLAFWLGTMKWRRDVGLWLQSDMQ